MAAERRQKRKEMTRRNRGIRRKSAAACRKVSRLAKVAWRKRNLFRNVQTRRNCGPRKRLTVTCIRTSRCAKVARNKERSHEGPSVEQGRRKEQTRNKFTSGARKGWTFGKRSRVDPEGSTGVKDPDTRRHRLLKNDKTAGKIFEKTFSLQIAKREDGYSVGSPKIRDCTLLRDRPPPKRKKKLKVRAGARNVDEPAPSDTERKKTTLKGLTEPYQGAAREERT
jgi:hypothetical protein